MSSAKFLSWPLFLFWSAVAVAAIVAIALHPTDGRWWGLLAASLFGAVLYFPVPANARMRRMIVVERSIDDVYRFLSQPANRQIWNPKVGPTEPSVVPVEVGQAWTFAPTNQIQKLARWQHEFSKLEPPNLIEITATYHGMHLTYAFMLRDLGVRTEVAVEGAVRMAIPVAWLSSGLMRFYPNRDLVRLKNVLELKPSSA